MVGAGAVVVAPGTGDSTLPGEGLTPLWGGVGMGVALPPPITARGGVGKTKPEVLVKWGGMVHSGTLQQKGSDGSATMVQPAGRALWYTGHLHNGNRSARGSIPDCLAPPSAHESGIEHINIIMIGTIDSGFESRVSHTPSAHE